MTDEVSNVAPPSPPLSPPADDTTAVSADDRNLAMLAHLLGIFFSIFPGLIIWLINKDNAGKAFVNTQAKEALNFQITVALAYILCFVLAFVIIGIFLIPIVWLTNVIFCILSAMVTSKGKNYRYPLALRLLN